MKALLLSIKPKYVAKILNGEKTIEIRKTMPKCDLPIDVYIYCTKELPLIRYINGKVMFLSCSTNTIKNERESGKYLNGKVVAKFTLKNIYLAKYQKHIDANSKKANELTCLTDEEIDKYLNCKDGYGWGIDDLVIFDRPKELGEFKPYSKYPTNKRLTKAPQSYMFVERDIDL